MKRSTILPSFLASLFLAGALVACASDPKPADTFPGTVKQESLADLAAAQTCDVDTTCPVDLECMFVNAVNATDPICVDSAAICDALDCGEGSCLVLETYPAQVMCAGDSTPGDDDDCNVSSDGTTDCPDDDDGSGNSEPGGSSEPGDPGQG